MSVVYRPGMLSRGLTAFVIAFCQASALGAEPSVDNPDLSLAGIWTPLATPSEGSLMLNISGLRYSPIRLADGRYGMVFGSFSLNPNPNPITHPVNAFAVVRAPDGRMSAATSSVLGDPVMNGTADVVVGDLNGDGVDDIMMVAHNEKPGTPKPSTAWLSSAGGLGKVSIDDAAVVHGATLTTYEGRPTVFGANLSTILGEPNPYYHYENGTLVRRTILGWPYQGKPNSSFNAEDLAFGDFAGDGTQYVVAPNNTFGPSFNSSGLPKIGIYKLADVIANVGKPAVVLDPYFLGKDQYKDLPSLWGRGVSDLPRVWTDDFNHDGKLDFTNIASLWPTELWTLQMLQNTTNGTALSFEDRGAQFWRDVPITIPYLDYSMQLTDIDGSGIDAYLFAGSVSNADPEKQTNFILLNDGSGQLHLYFHDQFAVLGQKVWQFLTSEYRFSFMPGLSTWPAFIAYPDGTGKLDFLAVQSRVDSTVQPSVFRKYLVNVDVNIDPAVDFGKHVTVADRNSSQKLRTWAGDDLFHDVNASPQRTTIDGGAGMDTAYYSGSYNQYMVERQADGSISVQGNGVNDTLLHIERLDFAGATVDVEQATPFQTSVIFEFAARHYPHLFAGTPTTGTYQQYTYASFPGTKNILAIDALGGIWLLGPATGNQQSFIGFQGRFSNAIGTWIASGKP